MEFDDLRVLVEALNPLVDAKIRGVYSSADESWLSHSEYRAIVSTDLEDSAVDQDQESWRRMLTEYDQIVAREVSLHGRLCSVVRPVRNGYLVVFETPKDAASLARRLQYEVDRHNHALIERNCIGLAIPAHNVALSYGSVSRVLRAHGYDYVGGAIDQCIDTASRLRGGCISLSRVFADQYENYVGKREFEATTRIEGDDCILEWP
jgi:hypothetical protein